MTAARCVCGFVLGCTCMLREACLSSHTHTHTHTHTGCGLSEREELRGDSEHSRHHNSGRLTERETLLGGGMVVSGEV